VTVSERAYAELSAGPLHIELSASGASSVILRTVDGWYGTPQTKVQLSERTMGYGAYVPAEPILYAARTVTLGVSANAQTSADVAAAMDSLSAFAGKMCRVVISDSGRPETEAHGYVEVAWDKGPYRASCDGTLTIVCPDPRRYGTQARRAYLSPGASAGALGWHADAPHGLLWPLSYGGGGAGANVATLRNDGTSTAYPIITASGDMDGLVLTDTSTGAQLAWDGHVGTQPVTLDCLSRAASVAGVDASRLLSSRSFPSVPAGGEVTLALTATGTGTVCAEWRDTYI
jgi:hypothetical protein